MKVKNNLMYLMMFKRLIAYALNPVRVSITNSIQSFADNIAALNGKITFLESLYLAYQQTSKSATAQRHQAHDLLCTITYTIMSSCRAYANDISDANLAKKMKVTLDDVRQIKLELLVPFCADAKTAVQAVLTHLGTYGIDTSTMTDWQTKIDDFYNLIPVPEALIDTHKNIGQQIDSKTIETTQYIKNSLDSLATGFIINNLDYFQGWRVARRLRHVGIRHTRIDVTVVDELSTPFENVTVTVNEMIKDGKTYRAVSGTTDINGNVIVEEFESGIRTVTVKGDDVVEKTFGPFNFVKGKGIIEAFTCQPAFNNLPVSKLTKAKDITNK